MLVESVIIGGAILSAYGKWTAGSDAKRAGKRLAREYERAAAQTLQRGEEEVFTAGIKGREVISQARLAMAGSNTDAEASVLRRTAFATELTTERIRENARREAWGLKRRAEVARSEGADAARAASIGAVGSLLGGASQAYAAGS